jgi:hypothetical protein
LISKGEIRAKEVVKILNLFSSHSLSKLEQVTLQLKNTTNEKLRYPYIIPIYRYILLV